LSVKKSAFNEIFIEDIEDSNINTKNKNNRSENICTRNDKSISHHYEMLAEKASKRPEQLASLVFLLRKSRQVRNKKFELNKDKLILLFLTFNLKGIKRFENRF